MIITIFNETKNMFVKLYDEQTFEDTYGLFSTADFGTRKYVAETENIFVLYGQSGFRKAPTVSDIRTKSINTNGSQRISGHSEDLTLSLVLEPLLHCFQSERLFDLYNYPLACFHNEFSDLRIEFDLGCVTLYQYYSFQEQSDDLTTFTFKGSRGGNTYYLKDGYNLRMLWKQDLQFMTPAKVANTITAINENYVNDKPIHNRAIEYVANVSSGVSFTIYPVGGMEYPTPFIDEVRIVVNGQENYYKAKFKTLTVNSDGTAIDQDGNTIVPTGVVPLLLEGINTIEFKPKLQRGDYLCEMKIENASMF